VTAMTGTHAQTIYAGAIRIRVGMIPMIPGSIVREAATTAGISKSIAAPRAKSMGKPESAGVENADSKAKHLTGAFEVQP